MNWIHIVFAIPPRQAERRGKPQSQRASLIVRRFLFFRSQQDLHSHISNPVRFAVLRGYRLNTAPDHEQQPQVSFAIERLAAAHVHGQLALLGSPADAICVLEVVELPRSEERRLGKEWRSGG